MAEKWEIQDSARTMAKKYNKTVDEINQSLKWIQNQDNTESTSVEIDNGMTNAEIDRLLKSFN